MDQIDSKGSDLGLDIDLESGGTSDEDATKVHSLSCEYSRNESAYGSLNVRDCSCSHEKLLNSDMVCAEKEVPLGKFRRDMVNLVNETVDKIKHKKQNSTRPPKPPRPPQGPLLNASDMKLLKDITELNFKRKKMERIRTMKKIKKEKSSSMISNIFALLVTILFFLVIIFQGFLGSRM